MRRLAIHLVGILVAAALFAVADFSLARLLHGGEAKAQQAGAITAAAATGSTQASVRTMAAGTKTQAVFSAQPPSLNSLSAAELARFQVAFANSHRSGPTNLPVATMRADRPVGPAFDMKAAANTGQRMALPQPQQLPQDFFAIDLTVLATGAQYSGVSEPSGDNAGRFRFHTANWFAAMTADFGTTWSHVNPFTQFGPGFCCDQVVVYDPGRNTWFWLLQYIDGHLVLANSKDLVNWCAYTFTLAGVTGTAGQFDYNDLALTTNNISIVSNVFPTAGGFGVIVMRLPIDPQTTCSGFGFNFFFRTDLGFTWKPVSGATDVLYWGTNWFGTLGSSFRVFKWADNSNTIFWFDRTLGTTFAFYTRNSGQNCGSQDAVVKNWCQFADSRVLGGARYSDPNGVAQLVFSFNANQGGPFNLPFPYTERVYFKESDFSYVGSDRIWNPILAFQFTSLATDARGHIGMTTQWGGGTGSTHFFPSGAVFLQDDISPTQPWHAVLNAVGAGNPCVSGGLFRWGDYTTTRPYRPTNTAFLGSNFVLTADAGSCGATAPTVDHDVIFGRLRDAPGGLFRWP